jgi:hypothetical protein
MAKVLTIRDPDSGHLLAEEWLLPQGTRPWAESDKRTGRVIDGFRTARDEGDLY